MRTASSKPDIQLSSRLAYLLELLHSHRTRGSGIGELNRWTGEMQRIATTYLGQRLDSLRIVEIGYGPRPTRMIWTTGVCPDVHGIDLDQPLLRLTPANIVQVLRKNGALRAVKTLVRSALFDAKFYAALSGEFEAQFGRRWAIKPDLFRVGDASEEEPWENLDQIGFVYAEDVFEHVPAPRLRRICKIAAKRLHPTGILVTNVNVFTGITGGHIPEWYRHRVDKDEPKASKPWDHLRPGSNVQADTCLNRLRPSEYDEMFAEDFEILERKELFPNLGAKFLTEDVRSELSGFSTEELLSNNIRYVLRPKVH